MPSAFDNNQMGTTYWRKYNDKIHVHSGLAGGGDAGGQCRGGKAVAFVVNTFVLIVEF